MGQTTIKKVIHSADWQLDRDDSHRMAAFDAAIEQYFHLLEQESKGFQREELMQVIAGDIFENYTNVSNDAIIKLFGFLKKALTYSPIIIILGNHDYDVKNPTTTNIVETLNELISDDDFHFLTESTCYPIGGLIWAHYAHKGGSNKPSDFDDFKHQYPNSKFIALYHDPIQNAKVLYSDFNNYSKSLSIFEGCDGVMAGDIHLRQSFRFGDSWFVYPGSPYQLTHGETIRNHGVVVWDIETMDFKYLDIEIPHNYITVVIDSPDDINNPLIIKNDK